MAVEDTQRLVSRVKTVATSAEVRAIVSAYMFGISTPPPGRSPVGSASGPPPTKKAGP
jgi:hypothetical protein